ncbi:MAG TPA: hypothetical protein VJ233_03880, partial [Hyphomicrobiaceae bacterium]|nr:hypothetical protein [Hyphomicrobiaceae bacterium]
DGLLELPQRGPRLVAGHIRDGHVTRLASVHNAERANDEFVERLWVAFLKDLLRLGSSARSVRVRKASDHIRCPTVDACARG